MYNLLINLRELEWRREEADGEQVTLLDANAMLHD